MEKSWQEKIIGYCEKYNIPVLYLADTLYEPKVVPMIRGKSFEFSVMLALRAILPSELWEVSKPPINAQSGLHDIDVKVLHKPTRKTIRVECKLAKKDSYRLFSDGHAEIRVKCMRSRTLGSSKVKELAPKLGVSERVLAIHNDQYLPTDFDIVATSIGNAFYGTDAKTGFFEWLPSSDGKKFLEKIGYSGTGELRDFAFSQMFFAKTTDLVIGRDSKVVCTRGACKNSKNCGFVPNYPIINFAPTNNKPSNGWVPLSESVRLFQSFVV